MAKNLTDRLRGAIYLTAASIGSAASRVGGRIAKREGVLGKVGGAVADGYNAVAGTVSKAHQNIQEQGGYAEAMRRVGHTVGNTAVESYQEVRDAFFTQDEQGGYKFDAGKSKQTLKDGRNAVAGLGKKACASLSELVQKGAESLGQDYRKFIPNQEELNSTYAGVGTKYEGVLLREHLDSCLAYHQKAMEQIPKGTKYRLQILEDIKASASSSYWDLVGFYERQVIEINDRAQKRKAVEKLEKIKPYLGTPEK